MIKINPITMLLSGTRGDVQPFIALGQGLQAAGYPVRLVTHTSFRTLVQAYGLPFVPLDGNPNELLARPEFAAALVYDGRPLHTLLTTVRYLRAVRPVFARLLASAWHTCRDAGALIVSLPTSWGCQIAAATTVPAFYCLLQPLGATDAFASPLAPPILARLLGKRRSHRLTEIALWLPWRNLLNAWRRDALGLPPLACHASVPDTVPRLFGFSPMIVPPPADWPASYQTTGYWFLDPPPGWRAPAQVSEFLAAGPPPVYIGFGSTGPRPDPLTVSHLSAALAASGQRALLATGSTPPPSGLSPAILPISDIPHAWLFPRVAAVLHHGGAGTTAAAFNAGVPAATVPAGIDQHFWGQRSAALGCALPPLPARHLDATRLTYALDRLVSDQALRNNAAALGARIRSETGVARAVAAISALVDAPD